jgi:hypothetical protein
VDVPPAHGKGHDFNVFSSVYPAELTQTGTVECTEETPGLVTHLWVYLLVVLATCGTVPCGADPGHVLDQERTVAKNQR